MFESSSESSSGVYKSKLFNFLNRRSQQLIDKSKTVLRHVQVATIWGVQIALYPVYLLIQTGRNFVWQLQETASKREAVSLGNEVDEQLILPPKVDKPIIQSLELVKEFLPVLFSQAPVLSTFHSHNDSPSDSTLLSTKKDNLANKGLFIQGVANLITSRKLVLVGSNNQILDILTPEQQQKLAKKIIWEVASYGYDRRRFFQSQKIISQQLPSPQSPQTLPPAKWFWQVMAWVQRGEVAIAANLFQESSLAVVDSSTNLLTNLSTNLLTNLLRIFSEINFSYLLPQPISTTTLQVVDQQVYEIEVKQITPVAQWLNQLGERLLPLMVSPRQVLSRIQHERISREISSSSAHHLENHSENNLENSKENIWALIQGAIAYFFGKESPQESSSIQGHHSRNYSLTGSIPSILYPSINSSPSYQELPFSEDDWLTDDWLISEDLFNPFSNQEISSYEDEDMIDIPSINETKLLSQTNNPSFAQVMAHHKKINTPPTNSHLAKRNTQENTKQSRAKNFQAIEKKLTHPKSAKSTSQRINSKDRKDRITTYCDRSPNLSDNSHNWIETEVTSKGYIKHPLQKCLEILDRITLWIEGFLGNIWRVIKKIVKI